MDKSAISMAMFNSYVSLPEGKFQFETAFLSFWGLQLGFNGGCIYT